MALGIRFILDILDRDAQKPKQKQNDPDSRNAQIFLFSIS